MSEKNMNTPDVAPTSEAVNNPEHPKNKKYVGYRLLALLVLVLSVAAFFLPMFKGVDATGAVVTGTLLSTLTGGFSSGNALFGVLPIITPATMVGGVYGLGVYLCVIGLVIAAIVALCALFSKVKAPTRTKKSLFFLVFGTLAYVIGMTVFTASNSADGKAAFDVVTLALAIVGTFFYFILCLVDVKKAVWINVLRGILTAVYSVLLILAIGKDQLLAQEGIAKILCAFAIIWTFVTMLIALVRLTATCGWVKDLVRHIISLVMAIVVCYVLFSLRATLEKPQYLLVILAALLMIVQIVIDVILIRKANKKEVEDAKEEVMQGFHTEEYAEAYAYEGGPVAGVLMAEEINPSFCYIV